MQPVNYANMASLLQMVAMDPRARNKGLNPLQTLEGGVAPYQGGGTPYVGTRAINNINRNIENPPLKWTPEVKVRMERRFKRAVEEGDDFTMTKLVKDAAKYGVDWSRYLP